MRDFVKIISLCFWFFFYVRRKWNTQKACRILLIKQKLLINDDEMFDKTVSSFYDVFDYGLCL